jgi:hypothetical protein
MAARIVKAMARSRGAASFGRSVGVRLTRIDFPPRLHREEVGEIDEGQSAFPAGHRLVAEAPGAGDLEAVTAGVGRDAAGLEIGLEGPGGGA